MQNQWLALFLHDRVNNYQLLLRDDAEKTARRYDHKVVVYSAEKDADSQTRQIRSVIGDNKSNPPTAVLVSPVRESSLIGAMSDAAAQRIPWAYLCRWSDTVHSIRRDHPGYSAFSVAADHTQIGRLQGQILARLVTDKHELVYIQGPQGTSSVSRRHAALRHELECLPSLRWAPFYSDWSTEGGANVMRSWLSNFKRGKLPEFAVCAQNDDMAYGARMALVEGGYISRADHPTIVGCDGLATFGQRLVSEGMLTATVVVPPVAGRALDELFRALSLKVTAPAEVSVEVLVYPTLERLTKELEMHEKLSYPSKSPTSDRRAPQVSAPPPSRTKPIPLTAVPPSRKVSKTQEEDPNVEASRLFATALQEVAASSRQATAARSLIVAENGGSAQPKQSDGTSIPVGGRPDSRR